jgi:hypothetical protein
MHYSSGLLYRGQWKQNEKGEWVGNPCNSAEVGDMLQACKHKDGEDGGRKHSCPITIEIMDTFYELGEQKICDNHGNMQVLLEVHWFQAFCALAWTLWTR